MGEDQGTGRTAVSDTENPEEIQREIEQTREELGETVEALATKADVKGQAKRKLQDTKASVAEKKDQLLTKAKDVSPEGVSSAASETVQAARRNPLPPAAVGAFAVGFLAGRLSKHKR
jgi:ElaB/YqjD/DUF883 family membrane-anchored ribosome-binding protein